MHDGVLAHLRRTLHERLSGHGGVEQARTASRLFAGDYSASTTVGEEFGGSRLGLGVMHDLDGEVVSVGGTTWRVPVDGRPREVQAHEGIAFGVAAHGGREHGIDIPAGCDIDGILAALDTFLENTHIEHEQVVCAVEISGEFTDVVLRTVAPPAYEGETLGEIIEDETRFSFPTWQGTLVGFRFPDDSDGQTIPGLHLHAIAHDAATGGHVRNATTEEVTARIWVDDLHPVHDHVDIAGVQSRDDTTIDFSRLEGSVDQLE